MADTVNKLISISTSASATRVLIPLGGNICSPVSSLPSRLCGRAWEVSDRNLADKA